MYFYLYMCMILIIVSMFLWYMHNVGVRIHLGVYVNSSSVCMNDTEMNAWLYIKFMQSSIRNM